MWEGIRRKEKFISLIPLTVFYIIWKERTMRAFDGIDSDMVKIKDRWFYLFGSLLTRHDLYRVEDFGYMIDCLTNM